MVTRPLDLLSRVRRAPVPWDWLYLVNVGLIALFFVLFHSKHVIAPGIVIQESSGERSLRLPVVPQAIEQGEAVALVIRVMGRDLVFTNDGKYSFREFQVWLKNRSKDGMEGRDRRLLVLADDAVSLNDFSAIFEAANEAGFTVQLAAEPSAVKR